MCPALENGEFWGPGVGKSADWGSARVAHGTTRPGFAFGLVDGGQRRWNGGESQERAARQSRLLRDRAHHRARKLCRRKTGTTPDYQVRGEWVPRSVVDYLVADRSISSGRRPARRPGLAIASRSSEHFTIFIHKRARARQVFVYALSDRYVRVVVGGGDDDTFR